MSNEETKEKGRKFERKVAEYFAKQGWLVFHHGGALGWGDNGIDIIASNGIEILLIQCKWSGKENSLGVEIYDKIIDGYETLKSNIILKPESIKYKLILACNSSIRKGKLSPVTDELYKKWINPKKNLKGDIIKEELDGEIVFFQEKENGELVIDRIEPKEKK